MPGTPQQRLIRYFESVNMIFGKSRAEIITKLGTLKTDQHRKRAKQGKEVKPGR